MIAIVFKPEFNPTSGDFPRFHLVIDQHCFLVGPLCNRDHYQATEFICTLRAVHTEKIVKD